MSGIIVTKPLADPLHTTYLFALISGLCWGVPNLTLKIYRRLVNSIIIRKILEVSFAAPDLQNSARRLNLFCMQTLQSSRAEATVI